MNARTIIPLVALLFCSSIAFAQTPIPGSVYPSYPSYQGPIVEYPAYPQSGQVIPAPTGEFELKERILSQDPVNGTIIGVVKDGETILDPTLPGYPVFGEQIIGKQTTDSIFANPPGPDTGSSAEETPAAAAEKARMVADLESTKQKLASAEAMIVGLKGEIEKAKEMSNRDQSDFCLLYTSPSPRDRG